MTILVSGGGTAGHITPILAVAHELKMLQPDCRIVYVGERGGKFQKLTDDHTNIDEVRTIFAGKFRRYHGESLLKRVIDLPTNLKNLRDFFFFIIGYCQSRSILKQVKPDVVFLKGGYVGLPVGWAAGKLGFPIVTHDSDALPGLSNKLVARYATIHATGMPIEYYQYPPEQTRYTGVLVGSQFKLVDNKQKATYRQDLNLPNDDLVLLITGGSLGAERLNKAIQTVVPDLLAKYPTLNIIHQVGKGKSGLYADLANNQRVKELEFLDGLERYTGAADVVVTRAGANTLAELGVQGKALIVVPNPLLTAGHQLKNADNLAKHQAVLVVDESELAKDSAVLLAAIEDLLDHANKRQQLSQAIRSLTNPHAAQDLANILIKVANKNQDV